MSEPFSTIPIILITEFPLTRQAVLAQIKEKSDLELLCMADRLSKLEYLITNHQPEVALVDIDKQTIGNNAYESANISLKSLFKKINSENPETILFVLSSFAHIDLIANLNNTGIRGYLLKQDGMTLYLADAIRVLVQGGCFYSKDVMGIIGEKSEKSSLLTKRQTEVLEHIIRNPNQSYSEHAKHLQISDSTLDTHLRHIYRKLEVNNLTAAIIKGIELDIISFSYSCRLS